jgi:hypothetical protein
MRMTITIELESTTLSARTEVLDQNAARKLAGDLFSQIQRMQNGHTSEVALKGWTNALTKKQAVRRISEILGVSLRKASSLSNAIPEKGVGQYPMLKKGPTDECKELELKLRDHGIYAIVRKVDVNS